MKVLVVYYSLYGHVLELAKAVAEGIHGVDDAESMLRRVPEFEEVKAEIREHEHAAAVWERHKEVPECSLEDLRAADAVVFGTPTRYGNMTAQMKRLIDRTPKLWLEGALEGKPAGIFTSTATMHGGQETTLLTMMVPLIHLGMILVGIPYSTEGMLHTEPRGGTPYGASTVAGQRNERLPVPEDLAIARALGRRVALIARRLRR